MKQAVKLLGNEWNLGKKESGATNNICAWIYLMEILKETEQFVYYKENGKLGKITKEHAYVYSKEL